MEGHADHYWNIAPTGSYFFNPHFSPYPSHYPYPEFSPPVYFSSFPSSTPPPPNSEVVDGAFTAVIEASRPVLRESSPLAKLVRALARTSHLGGVIILWIGPGPPQVRCLHVLPTYPTHSAKYTIGASGLTYNVPSFLL